MLFTEDMVRRLPHTEYWPKEPIPHYYELIIDCDGSERLNAPNTYDQEKLIDAIGENCDNVAVFIFDSMASALIFQAFYLNKYTQNKEQKAWLCGDPSSVGRYLVYLTRDRKHTLDPRFSWWAGFHKD